MVVETIDVRHLQGEYRTAVDAMTTAANEMVKPGVSEARAQELKTQFAAASATESRLNEALKAALATNEASRRAASMVAEAIDANRPSGVRLDKSKELEQRHYDIFPKLMTKGRDALTAEEREVIDLVEKRGTNSQEIATAGLGGNLVPTLFNAEMIKVMTAYSGVLEVANIKTTDKGGPQTWPKRDFTARVAVRTSERGASTRQDITWSLFTLNDYDYTDETRVSYNLMADSQYSIYDEFLEAFGESFGRAANSSLTNGDGTDDPKGLLVASTLGVTGASATALTLPEFIRLEHSVNRALRIGPGVGYMMNDQVLLKVKELSLAATNEGAGTWQPNFREGAPAKLNGYSYWLNDDMPSTVAAATKVAMFGNFKKYWVRRVAPGMVILRNDFLHMGTREVGFYAWDRWDGDLTDTTAVKHYITAAS